MSGRSQLVALIVAVIAVSACGGGGNSAESAETTTTVASTTTTAVMSGTFTPAAIKKFTVQTSLPAPGWWDGNDPKKITGGYEYALANEIGKRLATPETLVDNVSYEDLIAGDTGDATKFDVGLAEVPISARHKGVAFTIPYFAIDQGVMVNKGTKVSAANLRDLQWGVQRGTAGQSVVEEHIQPSQAPKTFDDLTPLFAALKAGDVDAVMMDTIVELPRAQEQHATVVAQFATGDAFGGVVPMDSPNLGAINRSIKAASDDGTLSRLAKKWLTPVLGSDPTKVPYLQVP